MAPNLGKRKRQGTQVFRNTREASEEPLGGQDEDIQDVFRRHFEAHFKPLPLARKPANIAKEGLTDQDGEISEWEGISEPEDGGQIEIIEHSAVQTSSTMSKDELKAFMTAKPPTDTISASPVSKLQAPTAKEDLDETANLKKDLALQRLLAESHLLDSSSNTSISGINRHKATDLRLQSLGAKTSILKQEKMPMSHRKGITSKLSEREENRRREARENGITLEKAKSGIKGQKQARRDRGIGGPGVGKFSGGTLRLSKKDIFDIEGPKKKFSLKGGRGRGRGGGTIRGSR